MSLREMEHVFRCRRCGLVFPSLDIHNLTRCPRCHNLAYRIWGARIDRQMILEQRGKDPA